MIILVILVAAIIGVVVTVNMQPSKEPIAKFYRDHVNYAYHLDIRSGTLIALKRDENRLVLGTLADHRTYDLTALMSVEVERNGKRLITTSRGSQVVGAAVGTLLLGGAGLVIGGLTGSRSEQERISELVLKITLDDPENPVHRVVFFKVAGKGAKPGSLTVKPFIQAIEKFHAHLTAHLQGRAREALPSPPEPVGATAGDDTAPGAAIEERIARLWQLKEAGALNDAEFAEQKARILQAPVSPALPHGGGAPE